MGLGLGSRTIDGDDLADSPSLRLDDERGPELEELLRAFRVQRLVEVRHGHLLNHHLTGSFRASASHKGDDRDGEPALHVQTP